MTHTPNRDRWPGRYSLVHHTSSLSTFQSLGVLERPRLFEDRSFVRNSYFFPPKSSIQEASSLLYEGSSDPSVGHRAPTKVPWSAPLPALTLAVMLVCIPLESPDDLEIKEGFLEGTK